jgi:hypothetical protein
MEKKSRQKDENFAVISSYRIKEKLPKLLHAVYFVYLSVDGEKVLACSGHDLFVLSCCFGKRHANFNLNSLKVLRCYFKILFQVKYKLYYNRSKYLYCHNFISSKFLL